MAQGRPRQDEQGGVRRAQAAAACTASSITARKQGSGLDDVQTLHRIDEDAVKKEILAAGFKLDAESDLLRNADDPRDWNASPTQAGEKRGTSDRFVLRFVKPGKAAKGKAGKK